ncbi:hypothetical protein C8Q77DRAFT_178023 [Trametes polyzona]|nr:hypothetical protein C8Q77DRAFT_178023 [Trametes polyzona]
MPQRGTRTTAAARPAAARGRHNSRTRTRAEESWKSTHAPPGDARYHGDRGDSAAARPEHRNACGSATMGSPQRQQATRSGDLTLSPQPERPARIAPDLSFSPVTQRWRNGTLRRRQQCGEERETGRAGAWSRIVVNARGAGNARGHPRRQAGKTLPRSWAPRLVPAPNVESAACFPYPSAHAPNPASSAVLGIALTALCPRASRLQRGRRVSTPQRLMSAGSRGGDKGGQRYSLGAVGRAPLVAAWAEYGRPLFVSDDDGTWQLRGLRRR